MNDLQKLQQIQSWKRKDRIERRDRKSKHEILYLNLEGVKFTIKHNKVTQTFIITSERHSFEVQYYTKFRSYHIRENCEKNINLTLMKKFNDDWNDVLHKQHNRVKLANFLISQFS